MQRKRVGIVIFDEVEVLDFCGPFEVFSVTRLHEERRREEPSPFEVLLVAKGPGTVTTTGGMQVLPHQTFSNCPRLDLLVVPGGWGTRREAKNAVMLDRVRAWGGEVETLTSVCTGSLVLAAAGLLDGRRATSHWRFLDQLQQDFPAINVEYHQHVVEDGNIITSAGISAGIDMALRIVARYHGETIARATARHMEYPFPDNNSRRVPMQR